jgi:hypothetical protein
MEIERFFRTADQDFHAQLNENVAAYENKFRQQFNDWKKRSPRFSCDNIIGLLKDFVTSTETQLKESSINGCRNFQVVICASETFELSDKTKPSLWIAVIRNWLTEWKTFQENSEYHGYEYLIGETLTEVTECLKLAQLAWNSKHPSVKASIELLRVFEDKGDKKRWLTLRIRVNPRIV